VSLPVGVKNGTLAYIIVSGISQFVPCVLYAHNQDFEWALI